MKTIKLLLMIFVLVLSVISNSLLCFAEESEIDLISILSSSEIETRDDLLNILDQYGIDSGLEDVSDRYIEESFALTINSEHNTIEVDTLYEEITRSTKSGKATHEVLNQEGRLIYTITAKGTFSYGSGYCNVTKKSGQFDRASGSFWTSTPSVTSGHVTTTKAYVKVSGTATCLGCPNRTYELYLYCTSSGTMSSTFSGT